MKVFLVLICSGIVSIGGFAKDKIETIPQSVWSAEGTKPVRSRMTEHTDSLTSIVIHHTESPNQPPAMEKGRLIGVQRYHIVDREWGDIAYHYLIGPSGKIYEGRDWKYQGDSGTSYDLNQRLLVCMVGNFTDRLPEKAAMESLVTFIAAKLHQHKLAPESVVTHRMVASTDCPGDRFQKWFEHSGKDAITESYQGEEYDVAAGAGDVPAGLEKEAMVKTTTATVAESGGFAPDEFDAIPSLANAPVSASEKDVALNLRYRSPDRTCEFGVMLVKVGSLGTSEYDRLITWKQIRNGERETSIKMGEVDPGTGRVTSQYGISGPGNAYVRYFLRSHSTRNGDGAYAVLWEWMVKDTEAREKWRNAYTDFKNSIDIDAYLR